MIVVSHELTIKALLAYLTKGRLDDSVFEFKVENAKPISLIRKDGGWIIVNH